MRASRIRPKNRTVRTWIMARTIEMFLVVRRTLNPAATSGVTCSKAALISREYGMPIVKVDFTDWCVRIRLALDRSL